MPEAFIPAYDMPATTVDGFTIHARSYFDYQSKLEAVMFVDVGRDHFRKNRDAPYSMDPLDEVIELQFKP